jgi:hypothetical protein
VEDRVSLGSWECAKASECFTGCSADPKGLVKESCLLDRKDEQALVQLTRRSARSPRRALEIVTTVISSAALRFVPSEDLHAEV